MATVDPHLFVIFGGTGDLTRRKLVPALRHLMADSGLAGRCAIVGVATTDLDDDGYRAMLRDALTDAGIDAADVWDDDAVFYHRIGRDAGYEDLRERIERIEADRGLPGNRVLYLALPPPVFPTAITRLGEAGLATSPGWTRLVVEKPFGTDLASAQSLNETVHVHFDESQVFRIDHYLGKETVQNLLALRFANPMFEYLWNRDRIASVEVTVAEAVGVEGRAGYYESAGALRDMVQNHLTQVLTLVAMEPPTSFDADQIRTEKVKVLGGVEHIRHNQVTLGQYTAGEVGGVAVPGYRDEDGVAPDSTTPTFAALEIEIDTWRWQGVPFYLRTGKRLPERLTQIVVTYQPPPMCIFHGIRDTCTVRPDVLVLTLQPDETFEIHFNVKVPGDGYDLERHVLSFSHTDVHGRSPDAYQTLILDVIEGDQTLFVRADEVEASWRLYDPLIAAGLEPHLYPAGTWGPAASDPALLLGEGPWMSHRGSREEDTHGHTG